MTLPRRSLLAGLLAGVALPARAQAPCAVAVGPGPGALRVANLTGTAQRLDRLVTVQASYDGAWHPVTTEMALNVDCPGHGLANTSPGCVVLEPHQTIVPPPWLGWSCNGQCNFVCRANIYLGEGPFRFVLRPCDGGPEIVSAAFAMPRQPASG